MYFKSLNKKSYSSLVSWYCRSICIRKFEQAIYEHPKADVENMNNKNKYTKYKYSNLNFGKIYFFMI